MSSKVVLTVLVAASMILPCAMKAQNCGPFTDVLTSNNFCPFIFEIFTNGVTAGTTATTYSPDQNTTRGQMAAFLARTMNTTLRRASERTAIGKTWLPTGGSGIAADVGGQINDIVTDGTYLWIARADGSILKVNAADRRVLENWSAPRVPQKLGIFGGNVWAIDSKAGVSSFNPADPQGSASSVISAQDSSASYATMAFDGTHIWFGSAGSNSIYLHQIGTSIVLGGSLTGKALGTVFDGANVWVLQSDPKLKRFTFGEVLTEVDSVSLPSATDCRMVFDGANIWIPDGSAGVVRVIRPSPNANPSTIVKTITIPDVSFPYVAAFDGTNVMIGGVNNGYVALYKASDLSFIRTINTGLTSIRSIASDGRTFNVGDASGTTYIQF